MNEEFEVITTSVVVLPKGKSIYDDGGTTISIEDEGAGEFVHITQPSLRGGFSATPAEWETIKAAINVMIENLRE